MNVNHSPVCRSSSHGPADGIQTGRVLLVLLCWVVLPSIAPAADPPGGANAVLHWTSGDSLPGRLTGVTADEVTWESGLFADPLRLRRSVLSSVQFRPEESQQLSSDEFRIALTTNDVLFGSIRALDGDSLELESSRHGRITVPRGLVAGIERINQQGLIYLGPGGLENWDQARIVHQWTETTDGSLQSGKADATLSRELPPVRLLAIEVILSFNQRPDFVLSLGGDDDKCLQLWTWDDALVAYNGDDFQELQLLADGPSTIHVLMYADLSTGTMSVCTPQGEVLARLSTTKPRSIPGLLSLQNGSGQIELQHLRVQHWNGTTVGSLVPGRTGLQQNDGQVHYGEVTSIRDGMVNLQTGDDSRSIPLQEVGSLEVSVLSADQSDESPDPAVRIKWRDGGMLQGEILEVTSTEAVVLPTWSSRPMKAGRQGIQGIVFSGGTNATPGPDELIMGGRLLHGHLVVDSGSHPVTWQPTGAINSVALRSGDNAVVKRSSESQPVVIDHKQYPDTIYLRNNDVIPCRVKKISEDSVQLSSPFSTATRFPATDITAVELSARRQRSAQGFADDQWKRLGGRVTKDGDSVVLSSGSFGSRSGFTGDRLSFHAEWPVQQLIFLTVHLFADNVNDPNATSCTLMFADNSVTAHEHFDRNNPFAAMQNQRGRIMTKGRFADIQLVTSQGELEVIVNGTSANKISLKRSGAGNTGVVFEMVNSGNVRFFGGRRLIGVPGGAGGQNVRALTLSQLDSGPPGGASIQKFIDEETRRHTLTIPRFRRDDPPTHALIAPNGDVLRGRLIGLHEDSVEFESRLEVFRFPRERVSAVIWIVNPAASSPKTDDEEAPDTSPVDSSVLQTVLAGGFLVSMTPERLQDGTLLGRSSIMGACRVPAAAISRLYLGDPAQRQQTSAWSRWRARHAVEPDWDIATSDGGSSAASDMIGTAAPDFELPQLDGQTFRLSDHAGKIVVIDFWATWCGPCVAALPDYIQATRFFDESDLVFVAVNIEESPQQIRAFLQEQELQVRVAIDAASETATAYQVNGIPHSVIISPAGIIEWVHVGYDPEAGSEVQRVAESILDGTWTREDSSDTNDGTVEDGAVEDSTEGGNPAGDSPASDTDSPPARSDGIEQP